LFVNENINCTATSADITDSLIYANA